MTHRDRSRLGRRGFLKLTAAGTLGYFVHSATGGITQVAAAPIPGGTLDPRLVPKFVTPVVVPPPMPHNGMVDHYAIAMTQFDQQVLPAGLPRTTVWSYGAAGNPATRNYPAFTIEAVRGRPTYVTWINGLVDGNNNFLPHLLPVDPTLHWANPPGPRDTRPTFATTPTRYTGPVPIVTHVHGMEHVHDHSDGYAEAWYLPAAGNIPAGYQRQGTWYDFFDNKAMLDPNAIGMWDQGTATFTYPNSQRPSTAWYHDHTLGMTRLNVYAGPAGFYLIRSEDPDDHPTDALGGPAVLPGPAPSQGDAPGTRYYEVPLAIQDRSFDAGGGLFYPDSRAFFDGFAGPYIPTTDISPFWNPEFFGNMMLVNGNTWPKLDVEPRRYRLRLLNGCQSRFLVLAFSDPKVEVWKIGNEGGYLRAPVRLTELLMAPAERADLIVDFSRVKPGTSVTMTNRGPDAPFGGGGFRPADPNTTGLVMRFDVVLPLASFDASTPPARLVMPGDLPAITTPVRTRPLALLEQMSMSAGVPPIPAETLLGIIDPTLGVVAKAWDDEVTENPAFGDVETWEFYNFTADAHPIHVHEVFFQVVNRQRLDRRTGQPIRSPRPPEPWENGFKDTVVAYPGEVTRVQMRFENEGQFVWHCHIVEHEDNEMMRPYRIGPEQPGQPMPGGHGGHGM